MSDYDKIVEHLWEAICVPEIGADGEEYVFPQYIQDAAYEAMQAIDELVEREMRWRKVPEEIPYGEQAEKGVLAYYDDGIESRIVPVTFHPKSGWWDCLFNKPIEHITHWMPLPEPPKEEVKDFPPYLDYPIKPKEEDDAEVH